MAQPNPKHPCNECRKNRLFNTEIGKVEIIDYCFRCPMNKSKEKPMEFQVGDIVDWHGAEGTVESITHLDPHCVRVHFDYGATSIFTIDGRYHEKHTSPSITLKSRPKKKVVVGKWRYSLLRLLNRCLNLL